MTWNEFIGREKTMPYLIKLLTWVRTLRGITTIYPAEDSVFQSLFLTPFDKVKVVIIGQDPYIDNNADGLAFSCKERVSPSLKKILGSLNIEFDPDKPATLEGWASQGVLLLNTILTVEKGFTLSHAGRGWEIFTSRIIKELIKDESPKVFLLWGQLAQEQFYNVLEGKRIHSYSDHIFVYSCEHPAAAAYNKRVWINLECFRKANAFLKAYDRTEIDWKSYNLKTPLI